MNKRYSKRDPIKDYFPLPNEIFCLGLSYGEIAVYSYLLYRENRKNFKCHPSYKTILKMSKNTVCKYVRLLEEKELIATEPTDVFIKDGKKLNGNLLYTILPIEQAKQYFYKRQLENIDQVISEDNHKRKIERLNLNFNEQAV